MILKLTVVKVMILVTCSVGLVIFQYLVGAFIYIISRILPLYCRIETGLYMGPP